MAILINIKMIRGKMKFWGEIGNKTIVGLKRWTYERVNVQMFSTKILANAIEGDNTFGITSTPSTTLDSSQVNPSTTPSTREKKKKNQTKLKGFYNKW